MNLLFLLLTLLCSSATAFAPAMMPHRQHSAADVLGLKMAAIDRRDDVEAVVSRRRAILDTTASAAALALLGLPETASAETIRVLDMSLPSSLYDELKDSKASVGNVKSLSTEPPKKGNVEFVSASEREKRRSSESSSSEKKDKEKKKKTDPSGYIF